MRGGWHASGTRRPCFVSPCSGGMTMFSRFLSLSAAALAALALTSPAQADDTLRLALPGSTDADTLNLKATESDLDADTLTVARGGYRGGFRGGFYGGYRGGY